MQPSPRAAAFSLVELSIVLVILGLLVGGVLSGRSLIHAAELRSVITEYEQWRVAINSFKQKYRAIPGDMPNATRFWGAAAQDCSTWVDAISQDGSTCNGSGSGMINQNDVTTDHLARYESLFFWHHLGNAGLVNHRIAPTHRLANMENFPEAKFGGGARWIAVNGMPETTPWNIKSAGAFQIGTFTPEDAWNIDQKIDDGDPVTGYVAVDYGGNCTRTTDGQPTTRDDAQADYWLESSAASCLLIMAWD